MLVQVSAGFKTTLYLKTFTLFSFPPSPSFSTFFFFPQMRAYYQANVSFYANSTVSSKMVYSAWSDTNQAPVVDLCGANESQLPLVTSSDFSSSYSTDDIFVSILSTADIDITHSSPLQHYSETYEIKMSYSTYILSSSPATSSLVTGVTSTSHFRTGTAHSVSAYEFFMEYESIYSISYMFLLRCTLYCRACETRK